MFDGRNSLSNEVSEQLKQHFGDRVFRTVVPRNVRLAEAPSYGKPAIDYDNSCIGAQAYLALASELIGSSRTTSDENIDFGKVTEGGKNEPIDISGR